MEKTIIFLCIVIAIFVWRIYVGSNRGIAKEVSNFIRIIMITILTVVGILLLECIFSKSLIGSLVMGVVFVAVVLARKLIRAILHLIELAAKAPVIKQMDHFAGFLLGVLEAFLLIWILMALVTCVDQALETSIYADCIKGNVFSSFCYEHNFLRSGLYALVDLVEGISGN